MENTATIDLELYDEFKKAIEFFEIFRRENGVFLGCNLNFQGNINRVIITPDEAVKQIGYNLNESRLDNSGLRDKIKILENEIKIIKENKGLDNKLNKYPWYKRIF